MGLFKKYTCVTCGEVFKKDLDLRWHITQQHVKRDGENLTYECPCGIAAGRWTDIVDVLGSRLNHMQDVHDAGWPPYRQ